MSSSTGDGDVEDVLSAIRRLLADGRTEPSADVVAPPGRLVLVPALRVEEAEPAVPPHEQPVSPAPLILHPTQLQPPSAPSAPSPPESGAAGAARDALERRGGMASADGPPSEGDGQARPEQPSVQNVPDVGGMSSVAVPNSVAVHPVPSAAPPAAGFDEAALRALIVEVVRQELQGEFGEKVTRNLRKLVRRELLQSLAERSGA